jgi:dodecin
VSSIEHTFEQYCTDTLSAMGYCGRWWAGAASQRSAQCGSQATVGGVAESVPAWIQQKANFRRISMAVAKVEEISATSAVSFEDAIEQGLARAIKTLRNVRSAWVKEQHVRLDGKKIVEYQVNLAITFVLDD